uniref:Uncharacterized protein n=1 Tax=Kalanchoe fedtschenkoi TaxID=63787 RepID=A0A7N0VB31_KALFE
MGLLQSLTVLCLLTLLFSSACISAQSRARVTDSLLQEYAYRALINPRTGTVYDGSVPANLTGIKVSALRLRSGSLRTKGVTYKEFRIPVGVVEAPYVERLVLVYQNLGNWSSYFYELDGYTHLTPVLGILAYDGANLSATGLPELDVRASESPISIKFADPEPAPEGSLPKCVWFDLRGLVNFSNVTSGSTCSTYEQGHFSIVVESKAPAPSPTPGAQPGPSPPHSRKNEINSRTWIIVGSVAGGLALVMLLSFIILCVRGCSRKKKMRYMERAAEVGESLKMTSVGALKAPAATSTRTQPTLESEHVA